ncbi:hypothetical protein SUGI_0185670 [Cryptomeria japonica]|uniref:stigma-specific STIG1-like protein 3 n=1 Tax=Cryptomeria japonica TaxID=3369 RepID=UPI002408A8E2|nr:stigma-specific STIG1-like protein 3 [Cryptomeria japonica]GLJ12157.1 hypothetical protein SUGI_0185670 [Cryptomeria japonica]
MGFLKEAATMLLMVSTLMAALVSAGNGRESRFLLTAANSKALDCSYNPYVCLNKSLKPAGPYCCAKKCVNVLTDVNNCGKCKNKCKYPSVCCNGKCTDIGSDRYNCGKCGVTCKKGSYCAYSMCSYA